MIVEPGIIAVRVPMRDVWQIDERRRWEPSKERARETAYCELGRFLPQARDHFGNQFIVNIRRENMIPAPPNMFTVSNAYYELEIELGPGRHHKEE